MIQLYKYGLYSFCNNENPTSLFSSLHCVMWFPLLLSRLKKFYLWCSAFSLWCVWMWFSLSLSLLVHWGSWICKFKPFIKFGAFLVLIYFFIAFNFSFLLGFQCDKTFWYCSNVLWGFVYFYTFPLLFRLDNFYWSVFKFTDTVFFHLHSTSESFWWILKFLFLYFSAIEFSYCVASVSFMRMSVIPSCGMVVVDTIIFFFFFVW